MLASEIRKVISIQAASLLNVFSVLNMKQYDIRSIPTEGGNRKARHFVTVADNPF